MQENTGTFTFIAGNDMFLVNRFGKKLFEEKTLNMEDDFSKELIDGAAFKVEDVERIVKEFQVAVQTLPMFGDKKVVWLKGVNFLADSRVGTAESTLALLDGLKETLAALNGEGVEVIITVSPLDRRREFPKWCEQNADFPQFDGDRKNAQLLPGLIREETGKLGVGISPDAVELLMAKVNGNARIIVEEIQKLAAYIGEEGSTIEERHIIELVPDVAESDFFEVAEAFFARDLSWTLDAIHRYFFFNKDARPLLGTLQNKNRLIIQLRALMDSGELSARAYGVQKAALDKAGEAYASHYEGVKEKSSFHVFTQNPWYLGRLKKTAVQTPLKKLLDFQMAFLDAFEEILQEPRKQEQIISSLAVRCLG